MSKETELSDEQIDAMPVWNHFVGLHADARIEIARAIISADRELHRGDASMPVAAWRYRTNNTHTHLIAIEPPDDAYDAGTLASLVLLADAQAALAAKDAEIIKAEAEAATLRLNLHSIELRLKSIQGMCRSDQEALAAQAVEIEGLKELLENRTRQVELDTEMIATANKRKAKETTK